MTNYKYKKSDNRKKIIFAGILFVLLFSFIVFGTDFLNQEEYIETNVLKVEGNTIVLGRDCKAIIADTTEERAGAIQLGIDKQIYLRPNTYDVFAQSLKSFNISVEKATFDNYDGTYYYSSIFFKGGNKIQKLDSKPSDAIALALRMEAPIYVNKTLLEKIGMDIC